MTDLDALARDISSILLLTGYFQLDDQYPEVKSVLQFLSKHPAQNRPAVLRYLKLKGYLGVLNE